MFTYKKGRYLLSNINIKFENNANLPRKWIYLLKKYLIFINMHIYVSTRTYDPVYVFKKYIYH